MYPDPEDSVFLNRVISVVSADFRETILSISTGEPVSMEFEIAREVFLSTTEISKITRLKIESSGTSYLTDLKSVV